MVDFEDGVNDGRLAVVKVCPRDKMFLEEPNMAPIFAIFEHIVHVNGGGTIMPKDWLVVESDDHPLMHQYTAMGGVAVHFTLPTLVPPCYPHQVHFLGVVATGASLSLLWLYHGQF